MAHISELALFDYVSGKGDLTTEETEHVQDCDDCRDEVISLRRVVEARIGRNVGLVNTGTDQESTYGKTSFIENS